MNKKYIKKLALDYLVGRGLPSRARWFSLLDDERAEILRVAELIKERKRRRGVNHLKRTYAHYCRKFDRRGTCSKCWPYVGAEKFIGRGWVKRSRWFNPKYKIKNFGDYEEIEDIDYWDPYNGHAPECGFRCFCIQ